MFYKKFAGTILVCFIALALLCQSILPALAAFDPQDPKAWAIASYQVKKAMPVYAPKSSVSIKRNKDVEPTLNSLLMLSHTTSDDRYVDILAKLGQRQVASIDSANKALDTAALRKGAKKFFLGPDYTTLKTAKKAVATNDSIIKDYKSATNQINSIPARIILNQSIKVLETHNSDLKTQLKKSGSGFSLFGWIIRPFKYK